MHSSFCWLYWGETAILFACTLAHIAFIPEARLGNMIINGRTVPASRLMMVGFFAVHGGGFVSLHLFFICVLFSGDTFKHMHGIADFVHTFLIASGAWGPLLLVAIAGALDVLTGEFHPAFVDAFARRLNVVLARPDPQGGGAVGSVVGGLYLRIFIMQAAIILGGMAAKHFGTIAPLVIAIGLKTMIDFVTRLGPIANATRAPHLSEA